MSLKIVQITIPGDKELPEIMSTFSPEENYLMIKLGSDCLNEARKVVAGLSQEEIYKKIKEESRGEVEKLELDLRVEREMSKKMEDRISKMYEVQIEQLKNQIEMMNNELVIYESCNKDSIQNEVNKIKQKYDLLLEEKDRQNQLNREVFDKAEKLINKTINKSSISIGDDGEQIFENLAYTFKDFEGFKIENKSKQGHKGDFHLFFKDFNILVDSKNYTGSVQKKEVLKIESDLSINDNMNFAWMVSLNSNISEQNKFTITPKWITTDDGVTKCILFINNLLSNKDPRDVLRQAWMICNDFYRLTKKTVKEDGELEKYRENFLVQKKQIEKMQERATEIRKGLNVSFNILKHMDNDLLEMLSLVSADIVNEKLTLNNTIKEWWDNNIEYVNDESKMTSTEIWIKFKKDNKDYIGVNNITIDRFKDIITGMINSSNYLEKTRNTIEFIGFRWKQIEVKSIDNLEIENLVIEKKEKLVKEKHKKKEKSIEFYFDEFKDKKILQDYTDVEKDIMDLSIINDVRPWQIVSLLVRYKVILKRDEARGYDKYKESDEYKNKINKKTEM